MTSTFPEHDSSFVFSEVLCKFRMFQAAKNAPLATSNTSQPSCSHFCPFTVCFLFTLHTSCTTRACTTHLELTVIFTQCDRPPKKRVDNSECPKTKRTRSFVDKLSRSQPWGPSCQCVRSNSSLFWSYWCRAHWIQNKLCGSPLAWARSFSASRKFFTGTTKRDETIDTSAETAASDHAGRTPCKKQGDTPIAMCCEAATRDQILDVPVSQMMEQLRRSADDGASTQNPATDCRADRRHGSLQGFLSGQSSTAFSCGREGEGSE